MDNKNKIKNTPKRNKFILTYGHLDETEMLREVLFAQQLQIEKLEKIRSNTSALVWWLIALPIVFGVIGFLLGVF